MGGGVLVVLVGLYVAGLLTTGDRVPNGTTVSGVDIGGMTPESASQTLTDELAAAAIEPVVFTYRNRRYEIDPEASGLSLDVDATVDAAGGSRTWNPIRMVDLVFGDGADIEPVARVDGDLLGTAVASIAEEVERQPQEPSASFTRNGKAKITPALAGRSVDQGAAEKAAAQVFLSRNADTVPLPVERVEPSVTVEDFKAAKGDLIGPATDAPIRLQLPGRALDLPVSVFAPTLSIEPQDGRLVARIDADALAPRLKPIAERVAGQPVDATVVLRGREPVVVPGRPGVTLDTDDVADAIVGVVGESGDARTAEVGTGAAQPDLTTADARALKITEPVSDFVTYFEYSEYRNTNQGRAAEIIDGTIVKPGETFSLNGTVGERTPENGFVKGFVISNGIFAEEYGGGVSQVATTTYNAAFFAGMTDVEHKPHSFYISRYPMGREATVNWPDIDLKFTNDSPYGVLIHAWVVPSTTSSSGAMHVEMFSTKYYDVQAGLSEQYNFTSPATRIITTDECYPNDGYGGFTVDVYRTLRRVGSDEVVRRDSDTVVYTPSDSVICR